MNGKRFTVNLHCVKDDKDRLNRKFPVQTFVTDDAEKMLEELRRLFANDMSGVNRIVILDEQQSRSHLSEADVGQAPRELE